MIRSEPGVPDGRDGRVGSGYGAGRGILILIVLVTAFNGRPAVSSIGPVLRELQSALGMSDVSVGVLTALPLLCFGGIGLFSGYVGRRLGTRVAMAGAAALVVLGLGLRSVTGSSSLFLAASFMALVGLAISNVLLPVAVRRWFPTQVGWMTGMYVTVLMIGTAVAAAVTVPIADAGGGWRAGLGIWIIPAAATMLLWTRSAAREGAPSPAHTVEQLPVLEATKRMHRNPRAWALALFLGLQAAEAFTLMGWLPTLLRETGDVTRAYAGALMSIAVTIGVPMSMLLSPFTKRYPDLRPLIAGLLSSSAAAYLGLMLAPAAFPLLWASFVGIGLCAYPVAMMLIGLRAGTDRGTAELSSLVQGVGFGLAMLGPLMFGALHEWTGGWTLPLWLLLALLVPKFAVGMIIALPGHFDEPVERGQTET